VDIVSVGEEGARTLMVGLGEAGRSSDSERCGDTGKCILVCNRRGDVVDGDFGCTLELIGFSASIIGDLAGFRAGRGGAVSVGTSVVRLCTILSTSSSC
jgi:hypothetical protein